MTAEPLRIVGAIGDDPRLDLRPVSDLNIDEFLEIVAQRFGIPTTGEFVIELVYRNGRFARGHKHETFTAGEIGGDPA